MKHRESPGTRPMVDVARYLGHGLAWVLSTGLFLGLGWLVDRWLGTAPLFTILGAFIGAAAGFYSLYHHLVVEPRQREEEERRKGGDGE
ncbi:MAG TPA: AtpZ/AtpI family protein [Longimicrobiales bacterium]